MTTAPLSFWSELSSLAGDIKLHHSIFALPWALLATVLASHRQVGASVGARGEFRAGQFLLILVCMVSARTVAMIANRLLDADFDAANPRTARRAVPAGRLSSLFMAGGLIVSALIFLSATAGFYFWYGNPWPVTLSVPVLAFLIGYSLMKRYTRLCHYYLGVALGLAPVCAWLAISGSLALPPLLMAAAVLTWTAGFDILYATQDYRFDVDNGLFSVPAKLGIGPALWVARFTHAISLGFIATLAWSTPELGVLFWIGVALASVLIVVEHTLVSPTDLSKLNMAFFTINGVISLILGLLGTVDVLLKH